MKKTIYFCFIVFITLQACAQKKKKTEVKNTTTYYLIRHSEKDRSDTANHDPNLSEQGLQRAENWANYFEDVEFDAVYATDYNRTKQTATPTAKANNLKLKIYNPSKINFESFMSKTKNKTVLIVGHSNTTPMFANRLLGEKKYEDMSDNDNSSLYIVTLKKDSKTSEVLRIE